MERVMPGGRVLFGRGWSLPRVLPGAVHQNGQELIQYTSELVHFEMPSWLRTQDMSRSIWFTFFHPHSWSGP